jgi:ribulose-phosphate 3-epimerase
MSVIVPAVLVPSREELENALARLVGLVDTVQIDVVDGRFIGPPTWPYTEKEEVERIRTEGELIPYVERFRFEIDLMVESPEAVVGDWISAGATKILAHVESTRNLDALLQKLQSTYGHEKGFAPHLLSFGLALNIDTDASIIEPYIDTIDYVQFMGIAVIGKQGQPFDPRVIRKIEAFKKKHPDMSVQVDGGVSLQTAPALLSCGVDRLCVGSALLKNPDVKEGLEKFNALVERYGIYEGTA